MEGGGADAFEAAALDFCDCLQLGGKGCDYGISAGFGFSEPAVFEPLLAGTAAALAFSAAAPKPVLVSRFDLVSKVVCCIGSTVASDWSLSSSVFLNSAFTPLSFNFW